MERNGERGSVIILIIIFCVLFAALSYAVTQSMRSGTDVGNTEKLNLQTNEILSYANGMNATVRALIASGCTDKQISFENPVISDYINSSAPADKSCHIFDAAGGGLDYQAPSKTLLDPSQSSKTRYGQWVFSGNRCLKNVGTGGTTTCDTGNTELIMYLPYITYDECMQFMKMSGASNISSEYFSTLNTPFTGDYSGGAMYASSTLVGLRMGCVGSAAQNYSFFMVLLAR